MLGDVKTYFPLVNYYGRTCNVSSIYVTRELRKRACGYTNKLTVKTYFQTEQ